MPRMSFGSPDPTPASDIIHEAEAVSALTADEMVAQYIGQTPTVLTAALAVLVNDGLSDDQVTFPNGATFHRVDRWILETDTNGMVESHEFETEGAACREMVKASDDAH